MARRFHTLDVFTDTIMQGNPLAVVLDADGLDDETMQAVAREFNLSETVFVLPAEQETHTARIRIFTPGTELDFAGHPTVGTAILLSMPKAGTSDKEEDAIIVLEENIGPVRVGVRFRPGEAPFAEFDVPSLGQEAGEAAPKDKLATALGLTPAEIGFENHKPVRYSAGNAFTFVPVRDLEVIAKAVPVHQHWRDAFGDGKFSAAYLYCRECIHTTSAFHARMFAPEVLSSEDPATGSAVAALASVIHRFDEPTDGTHRSVVEQGFEMGRPSRMHMEMQIEGGKLRMARIGGHVVPLAAGVLSF